MLHKSGQLMSIYNENNFHLWYETFGDKNKPAVLLIMGACAQGIFWPDYYCNTLAQNGYFVIRYDNRDTGLSTSVDFNTNPYDMETLAKDAVHLLKNLNIENAHIIGTSMGGYIAQLIAAQQPDLVLSLTLIASTTDLSCLTDIIARKDPQNCHICAPHKSVIDMLQENKKTPRTSQIESLVNSWKILNGENTPFMEKYFTDLAARSLTRIKNGDNTANHLAAILKTDFKKLFPLLRTIKAKTLILHGDADPILPLPHGKSIASTIPNSKLIIIPTMGHMLAPQFDSFIVEKILTNLCGK